MHIFIHICILTCMHTSIYVDADFIILILRAKTKIAKYEDKKNK